MGSNYRDPSRPPPTNGYCEANWDGRRWQRRLTSRGVTFLDEWWRANGAELYSRVKGLRIRMSEALRHAGYDTAEQRSEVHEAVVEALFRWEPDRGPFEPVAIGAVISRWGRLLERATRSLWGGAASRRRFPAEVLDDAPARHEVAVEDRLTATDVLRTARRLLRRNEREVLFGVLVGETQVETAARVGQRTRQRICQLQQRAIGRLRAVYAGGAA